MKKMKRSEEKTMAKRRRDNVKKENEENRKKI